MTCSSFPNKPEPGLLDEEFLRLSSAAGKTGASSHWILPKPSWGGVGGLGSVVCCTQVLDEWESECARSPRIPEELELLHTCGEPVS